VRGAESKERDEVERLPGSGRLPKEPCCHLRRFVSGVDSVKKERAAASMFKTRAPHRSSCSRRAEVWRGPSTEIRLDLNSAPQTHEPLLLTTGLLRPASMACKRTRSAKDTSDAEIQTALTFDASGLFR
jgi:hypothetical protein